MKTKILLFSIVLATLSQIGLAQDKKFNFGFKVGPSISWFSIDERGISSEGAVPKLNWGFIGAYNFSENFALLSGFNVNSLGGKVKVEGLPGSFKTKYSEFQLPAIFQMKTNEIGSLKFYAQIGLAAGYVFKAKDDDDNSISNETNDFETSYILAGGVEKPVNGGVSLIAQVKYNGGFTSIMKEKETNFQAKINFVELGLGVLF